MCNVLVGEKRPFQLDTFDSLFVHVDEEVNMDSTSTSAISYTATDVHVLYSGNIDVLLENR